MSAYTLNVAACGFNIGLAFLHALQGSYGYAMFSLVCAAMSALFAANCEKE